MLSKNGPVLPEINKVDHIGSDFETAISSTKFGKFNGFLLVFAAICSLAACMTFTVTSFIAPFAECDLHLTLQDKGWLNSVVHMGMVCSAFLWGFLSDRLGRKKLLVGGLLANSICVILSGISQNFTLVLIFKFLDGFTMSGPHAILNTTLSEFHCAKYRAKILMLNGIFICSGNIIIPLLGDAILTSNLNTTLFGFLTIKSWNVFVLVTALPSFIGSLVGMCFLPESPKFLMTKGRFEDALDVFKSIYSWNTGNNKELFPVKALHEEHPEGETTCAEVKVLFFKPYALRMILIVLMHFAMLGGTNIIRTWFPQILVTIEEYTLIYNKDPSLCETIDMYQYRNTSHSCNGAQDTNSNIFYIATIPSVAVLFFSGLTGILVNKIGKNKIYISTGFIAGTMMIAAYFSTNSLMTIVLLTIAISLSSTNCILMVAIVVDLFPTTLRALAVSTMLTSGRISSMSINMVFPILLQLGCLPPIMTISTFMIAASLLVLVLPSTDMKALQ